LLSGWYAKKLWNEVIAAQTFGLARIAVPLVQAPDSRALSAVHFDVAMAADTVEAQPRGSLEFVESSVLEAVVPAKSEFDIKSAIESWDGAGDDNDSILPFLAQRQVLLLGTSH
jgi:hypothetical protein